MKTVFFKRIPALLLLVLCLSSSSMFAQKRAEKIAPKDVKTVKEIFQDVDPSQYRLIIDGKVYGKKRIKMSDLKTTRKTLNARSAGVKWTLIAGDRSENEVIYIYTEGMSELVSVIGREKARQLQTLASKYVGR